VIVTVSQSECLSIPWNWKIRSKLEYCDTERDLGEIMSTDLKVESQCNEACLKANRMLDLIKRTFVVKTPEVMLNLYKTCSSSISRILHICLVSTLSKG